VGSRVQYISKICLTLILELEIVQINCMVTIRLKRKISSCRTLGHVLGAQTGYMGVQQHGHVSLYRNDRYTDNVEQYVTTTECG